MGYEFYNPHPQQLNVGDCVKRAFTKATGKDYHTVQIELNRLKRELNQPRFNSDKVWREYLIRNGFKYYSFPAVAGQKRVTVSSLADSSGDNDVWVCRCAGHVVCIKERNYYDSWNSGEKCVYGAYKLEK